MSIFNPDQYAKAVFVNSAEGVYAPAGKLSDVLTWLENPPRDTNVLDAKILISGTLYSWRTFQREHHCALMIDRA